MQENITSERGLRAERRQSHPATAESACADFPSSASRLFLSGMRGSFGPAVLIEAPHKKVRDLCGPPTFLNMLDVRIAAPKPMAPHLSAPLTGGAFDCLQAVPGGRQRTVSMRLPPGVLRTAIWFSMRWRSSSTWLMMPTSRSPSVSPASTRMACSKAL